MALDHTCFQLQLYSVVVLAQGRTYRKAGSASSVAAGSLLLHQLFGLPREPIGPAGQSNLKHSWLPRLYPQRQILHSQKAVWQFPFLFELLRLPLQGSNNLYPLMMYNQESTDFQEYLPSPAVVLQFDLLFEAGSSLPMQHRASGQ